MTTPRFYDRAALVDVLLHHRPTESSACACGGVGLGRSWPEHIADVYEEYAGARERMSGPRKAEDVVWEPTSGDATTLAAVVYDGADAAELMARYGPCEFCGAPRTSTTVLSAEGERMALQARSLRGSLMTGTSGGRR